MIFGCQYVARSVPCVITLLPCSGHTLYLWSSWLEHFLSRGLSLLSHLTALTTLSSHRSQLSHLTGGSPALYATVACSLCAVWGSLLYVWPLWESHSDRLNRDRWTTVHCTHLSTASTHITLLHHMHLTSQQPLTNQLCSEMEKWERENHLDRRMEVAGQATTWRTERVSTRWWTLYSGQVLSCCRKHTPLPLAWATAQEQPTNYPDHGDLGQWSARRETGLFPRPAFVFPWLSHKDSSHNYYSQQFLFHN